MTTETLTAGLAFLAALVSLLNNIRIRNIHYEINSRMNDLLEATKKVAHAAGMKEQKDKNE